MGSKSQRKEQYARLMTAALDLTRIPPALNAVLDVVGGTPIAAKTQDHHQ